MLCVPGLLAALVAIRVGWTPTSDSATIATRAHDVLTPRSPLVGQYSLVSGGKGPATHSLGPLLYWLLALPVRLSPAVAPALAIVAVNTLCLVAAARLAFRHGGRALGVAVTLGALVLVRSTGLAQLASIWNPTAALIPFVALVWVGWAVVCGRARLLPVVVVLASLVAQCHLTYVLPALVISAGALTSIVLDGWRVRRTGAGPRPEGGRRLAAVTALVAVACWSAPLVEQVSPDGGNLTRVAGADEAGEGLGAGVGLDHLARMVAGPPPWLRDRGTTRLDPAQIIDGASGPTRIVALAVLGALVVVTVTAGRRRDRPAFALGASTCALALAAAVVAALLPRDRVIVAGYSLWWTAPVGLSVWLALGFGLLRAVPARTRAIPLRAAVAVATVVAVVLVGTTSRDDPLDWSYAPATTFADAAAGATAPGERYLVDAGELGIVLPAAVALELRATGRDPVLPASIGSATGDAYAARGERCAGLLAMAPSAAAPEGELLARTTIDAPEQRSARWDLVLVPDEGDPSC